MTIEWSLAAVHDVLADAAPDRAMLVWKDVRRSYGEVAERSRGLAGFFVDRGVTVRRERDELERWECGQVPVALMMHNRPEYIEAMLASYRARAVPFNVNHQYQPAEIRSLLDMVGAGAIVYQRSFGSLVAQALAGRPTEGAALDPGAVVLVDIDDGSGAEPLPGSTPYEDAVTAGAGVARPTPSADDLYLVCTGGTTGSPKGVLWRQADIFVAGMAGTEETTAESLQLPLLNEPEVWFAAPPLMHAAAQWTAFCGLHGGATVVMHDDSKRFDAAAILEVAERERITLVSIVGDAYARPLVEELRRTSYDLSSLQRIGTGGAMTSSDAKEALVELLPHVMVIDGYGSSETGGMAFGPTSKQMRSTSHLPAGGAFVLSAERDRSLEAGEDEIGWIARRGRVPLGYLNDRAATEATFPIIDGQRVSVPGDRGRLLADGTIQVLGRDSLVINTGGEKVFVEEVEQALLSHPDVVDVLVVGRPSERFGQEVVAVVQLEDGVEGDRVELREHCTRTIARFKAPRAFAFTETIGRHPTGKPDYRWAKEAAELAVAVPVTAADG